MRRDVTAWRHMFELVRPACMIEKMSGSHRHVKVPRLLDRLPAVQRFRHGKLPRAVLQQPRNAVDVFPAFTTRHSAPYGVECLLRRLAGDIHILGACQRDVCELLLVPGVDGRKIFPVLWRNELPVYEELIALFQFGISSFRRWIELPQIAKDKFAGRLGGARGAD